MKRSKQILLSLLIFSLFSSRLSAQLPAITSLTIIPSNPTIHDVVKVVSQTMFSSGSCELTGSSVSINGGIIEVYALHTVGMLTYICSSTDTLSLGTLESGIYKLLYHLSCTPYPSNTDLDSVSFTVETFISVDLKEGVQTFTLFPNPAQNSLNIAFPESTSGTEIFVVDQLGKELLRLPTEEAQATLDITDLAKGMYIIKVKRGEKNGSQKFIKF
jgi:hypothetical protein